MENRYEIRYDEIIPRTSCTDRSNGCTIIPVAHYPNTRDRQPCATLTRHGGRMLATDATTSSASKSPPHERPLFRHHCSFDSSSPQSSSRKRVVSLPRPTIFLRHPSCSFEQSILHPPYYFFHPARKVSWRRIRSSSASGINFRPEKLVSRIKFHLEMNFIHRSFPVQINFILTEGKNYYAIRREIRCQPVVSYHTPSHSDQFPRF